MFIGAPSPFNTWFPALDVSQPLASLQSGSYDFHINTYRIPQTRTPQDITLTFYDDEYNTLSTWISMWINNTILNQGKSVSPIGTPGVCKTIMISRLNTRRQVIRTDSYWVYPDGIIPFHGGSTPEITQYSINFVIAGIIGENSSNSNILNLPGIPGLSGVNTATYTGFMDTGSGSAFPLDFPTYSSWQNTIIQGLDPVTGTLSAIRMNSLLLTHPQTIGYQNNLSGIQGVLGGIVNQLSIPGAPVSKIGISTNLLTQGSKLNAVGSGLSTRGMSSIGAQVTGMGSRVTALGKFIA
jgi:hypothetical protein